jgi:hypothetical protein
MPSEAVSQTYLDVPMAHPEAVRKGMAVCKTVASEFGHTMVTRSNDPSRYLMPDIGSYVPTIYGGTPASEHVPVQFGDDAIIVRISATDDTALLISQALEQGAWRSLTLGQNWVDEVHGASAHGSGDTNFAVVPFVFSLGAGLRISSEPDPASLGRETTALPEALIGVNPYMTPDAPLTVLAEPGRESPTLRDDATAAEIATRISELSGLSDAELARLFRVARETFQRWRTGELSSPTPPNRRRLNLLVGILTDLAARQVVVQDWLRNVSTIDALTPYELLAHGRIDAVENLAAQVAGEPPRLEQGHDGMSVTRADGRPGFAPRGSEPSEDLDVADDADWVEVEAEAIGEDA